MLKAHLQITIFFRRPECSTKLQSTPGNAPTFSPGSYTLSLRERHWVRTGTNAPQKTWKIKIFFVPISSGRTEATEAFFAMTKLFQSKDVVLRRLVYLAIKELSDIADDVIIVTSSLTKDMTGKEDNYRAPAIRALTCIVDASMIQSIERYMKQVVMRV